MCYRVTTCWPSYLSQPECFGCNIKLVSTEKQEKRVEKKNPPNESRINKQEPFLGSVKHIFFYMLQAERNWETGMGQRGKRSGTRSHLLSSTQKLPKSWVASPTFLFCYYAPRGKKTTSKHPPKPFR